jgi:hypothetical protein
MGTEGGQSEGAASAEQPQPESEPRTAEPQSRHAREAARRARSRQPVRRIQYDRDGRARDDLGRIQPSRVNWLGLIRAIPSLIHGPNPAFDRRVPPEFWASDTDEDRAPVAVVACPCGEEPRPRVTQCVECECGRFYLATGNSVLVANSPRPLPEDPTPVVD